MTDTPFPLFSLDRTLQMNDATLHGLTGRRRLEYRAKFLLPPKGGAVPGRRPLVTKGKTLDGYRWPGHLRSIDQTYFLALIAGALTGNDKYAIQKKRRRVNIMPADHDGVTERGGYSQLDMLHALLALFFPERSWPKPRHRIDIDREWGVNIVQFDAATCALDDPAADPLIDTDVALKLLDEIEALDLAEVYRDLFRARIVAHIGRRWSYFAEPIASRANGDKAYGHQGGYFRSDERDLNRRSRR